MKSAVFGILVLITVAELVAQSPFDLTGSRRRASGAPVAPVFEGWEPNPDGSFNLYFGYQNRNWQEEVDLPVGATNFFSPGPQDRGQPTHFLTNRQKRVFTIVVPKDFGRQTLVWTIVSRNSTESVPGKLSETLQIDTQKDGDNAAPKLTLGRDQTITVSQAATLAATMVSGRNRSPAPEAAGGRSGRPQLTVSWRPYRGPGRVTFANATPPVRDGQATTTATFSAPGVYVLQAVADEGSMGDNAQSGGIPGFLCCWTNGLMTVTVNPAPGSARP